MGNYIEHEVKESLWRQQQMEREVQVNKNYFYRINTFQIVGAKNSGKSLLFNHLTKINEQYTLSQKRYVASLIRTFVIHQMIDILEQHPTEYYTYQFDEDILPFIQVAQQYTYVYQMLDLPRDSRLTVEVVDLIKKLWSNDEIKRMFEERTNLDIMDNCTYFFGEIDRIADVHYLPSDKDLLLQNKQHKKKKKKKRKGFRKATCDIAERNFDAYDINLQENGDANWLYAFEKMSIIIFVIDLCCFGHGANEGGDRVHSSIQTLRTWKQAISNKVNEDNTYFILLFNKVDLFKDKLAKKSLRFFYDGYDGPEDDWDKIIDFIQQLFTHQTTNPIFMVCSFYFFFVFILTKNKMLQIKCKHSISAISSTMKSKKKNCFIGHFFFPVSFVSKINKKSLHSLFLLKISSKKLAILLAMCLKTTKSFTHAQKAQSQTKNKTFYPYTQMSQTTKGVMLRNNISSGKWERRERRRQKKKKKTKTHKLNKTKKKKALVFVMFGLIRFAISRVSFYLDKKEGKKRWRGGRGGKKKKNVAYGDSEARTVYYDTQISEMNYTDTTNTSYRSPWQAPYPYINLARLICPSNTFNGDRFLAGYLGIVPNPSSSPVLTNIFNRMKQVFFFFDCLCVSRPYDKLKKNNNNNNVYKKDWQRSRDDWNETVQAFGGDWNLTCRKLFGERYWQNQPICYPECQYRLLNFDDGSLYKYFDTVDSIQAYMSYFFFLFWHFALHAQSKVTTIMIILITLVFCYACMSKKKKESHIYATNWDLSNSPENYGPRPVTFAIVFDEYSNFENITYTLRGNATIYPTTDTGSVNVDLFTKSHNDMLNSYWLVRQTQTPLFLFAFFFFLGTLSHFALPNK
ncbi:hypothetical protein RFI_08691 [Reticulomyxa filosa]|uniref:Uncharacterized protein n=1 Tax=Reticulomyxa filosa TaxID=46433 RepID=X6NRV9_RETFI|nr:hypothetical protein RFI_08691 [Reticulomyxa filosa]|eukprot:ETO28439.1 hypothetical protein RFI_08691 [Reticulomyxa filosa]